MFTIFVKIWKVEYIMLTIVIKNGNKLFWADVQSKVSKTRSVVLAA